MERLKHKIARVYYNHGLFCTTHPVQVIVVVCLIVVVVSYPITQILLVSDVPLDHIVLREDEFDNFKNSRILFSDGNTKQHLGYTLQIILHSKSTSSLRMDCGIGYQAVVDAISQSFRVVQLLRQFHSSNRTLVNPRGLTMNEMCFQVEDLANNPRQTANLHVDNVLPTFGCLLLSPSLLWAGDHEEAALLSFKPSLHSSKLFSRLKGAAVGNLRDLVFGIPWKMTGIHQFSTCQQEATVVIGVTLVLRDYDPEFLSELRQYLASHYQVASLFNGPSSTDEDKPILTNFADEVISQQQSTPGTLLQASTTPTSHIYLVWYRGRSYLSDYAPLLCIYLILLHYVYFSVSKLEMVKSKCGLAFSACFTVVASLCMSIGICVSIGLMVPTLSGSEVFPYLVVLIGFENIVILTKSVVATPIDLPVKYRIAQGLRKESWPLTKHYFTNLLLLGLGFLTFHPRMQEFCLIAVVGLTTDFFLQLFFFVTVLSIDIRRMELTDLSQQHSCLSLLRDPKHILAVNRQATTKPVSCPLDTLRSSSCDIGSHLDHSTCSHHTTSPDAPEAPSLSNRLVCALRFSTSWLKQWVLDRMPQRFGRIVVCWSRLKSPFKRHKRKVSAAQAAAFLASDDKATENVPIRLRVLRIWAKHRLFQRIFLWILVLWLACFLLYAVDVSQLISKRYAGQPTLDPSSSTASIDYSRIFGAKEAVSRDKPQAVGSEKLTSQTPLSTTRPPSTISTLPPQRQSDSMLPQVQRYSSTLWTELNTGTDGNNGHYEDLFLWNYMAVFQWPLLATHYNLTLAGNHLALLEPIHLHRVTHHPVPAGLPGLENSVHLGEETILPTANHSTSPHPLWEEESVTGIASTAKGSGAKDRLLHDNIRTGHSPSTSPGGFAGWTARLWLTASLAGTSLVGCSLVLLTTCLGMLLLHELQLSKSSKPKNQEPVIRVLPQTISLSSSSPFPAEESREAREQSPFSGTIGWTFACGQVTTVASDGSIGSQWQGVVAAASVNDGNCVTDEVNLWSTDSGSRMAKLCRYSQQAITVRQSASGNVKPLLRKRSTVWCMSFLPESDRLIVGCSDGTIELWDCNQGKLDGLLSVCTRLLSDEDSQVSDVSENPSGSGCREQCRGFRCIADSQNAPREHPGGVTVLKVFGPSSFVVGTSRGYLSWFSFTSADPPVGGQCYRPHTRSVTCLASSNVRTSQMDPTTGDVDGLTSIPDKTFHQFVASASEDGHVVVTSIDSENLVFKLKISSSSIIGLDFCHFVLAVSCASGGLYVILLTDESACYHKFAALKQIGCVSLTTEQSSTGLPENDDQISAGIRASIDPPSPPLSVSLRLVHRPRSTTWGVCSFRLVTCKLDGSIVLWSLKPAQILRSFKCNFSPLLCISSILMVDDRIIFGDQSYLRAVNPWTAKYERSVQLIPPSTALLHDSPTPNFLSTHLLSKVLRKWSRELIPLGVTNQQHTCCLLRRDSKYQERSGNCSGSAAGSVLVSLADGGQTLVVIPLSTLC